MRMIFFSLDRTEVETVRDTLVQAGIPCEVREGFHAESILPTYPAIELWVKREEDVYRSVLLCIGMGIGFIKRPHDNGPRNRRITCARSLHE